MYEKRPCYGMMPLAVLTKFPGSMGNISRTRTSCRRAVRKWVEKTSTLSQRLLRYPSRSSSAMGSVCATLVWSPTRTNFAASVARRSRYAAARCPTAMSETSSLRRSIDSRRRNFSNSRMTALLKEPARPLSEVTSAMQMRLAAAHLGRGDQFHRLGDLADVLNPLYPPLYVLQGFHVI